MLRVLAITLALLFAPSVAAAAETDWPAIATETFRVSLPGPRPRETRDVYYWRPPNTSGVLPALYLAVGLPALKLAIAQRRPEIVAGRAQPILVVALEPSEQPLRFKEYVLGRGDNPEWTMHFSWFVNTVLPWAERNIGATPSAADRGVGGVSNGADFAIAAATRRTDLFTAVLAHSPVNEVSADFEGPATIRWVLTVGSREFDGVAAPLQERIVNQIDPSAPLRLCVGPWEHDLESWSAVTPGSIAWLFELSPPGAIDTAVERRHCHVEHRV